MMTSERVTRRSRIVGGLRAMGLAMCAASLLGVGPVAPAASDVSARIAGVGARYTSNSAVSGNVIVVNDTDADVHYTVQMTGDRPTPDGHSLLRTIGYPTSSIARVAMPTRYEAKAHSQSAAPFTVQACEVISDPCVGTIAASVTILETGISVTTAAVPYTAIADRSATFRVRDLGSDTTIFVATRTTRHVVPVDTLVVSVDYPHAQQSATFPAELDASVDMLKQRGINGTVDHNAKGDAVSVVVVVPSNIEASAVDAAVQEIKARFGDRLTVKRAYIAVASCLEPDEHSSSLQPIAAYVDVPFLRYSGWATGAISVNIFGPQPTVAPYIHSVSGCPQLKFSTSPTAYIVYAQTSSTYYGTPLRSTPKSPEWLKLRSAVEAFDIDQASFVSPLRTVEIASDRCEISAIGIANSRAANASGIDGTVAAFAVAAAKARDLAGVLGARPGTLSLVATYGQRDFMSTVSATEAEVSYAVDTPVRVPQMPSASPTPTPEPTHTPGVPYAIFRQAQTPQPAYAIPPSADIRETPIPVAVTAPVPATLVTGSADVAVTVAADEDAMTIRVRAGQRSPGGAAIKASAAVLDHLRARRDVIRVSSVTTDGGVDFYVLASDGSASTARAIVSNVRHEFPLPVEISAAAVALRHDCRTVSYEALAKSVALAQARAVRSAIVQGRTLRRLVLATAAASRISQGACSSDVSKASFPTSAESPFASVEHPIVRIDIPVSLTYRTRNGLGR